MAFGSTVPRWWRGPMVAVGLAGACSSSASDPYVGIESGHSTSGLGDSGNPGDSSGMPVDGGSDDGEATGYADATGSADEAGDEADSDVDGECEMPPADTLAPRWLDGELERIVAVLSGHEPLPDTETLLVDRATAERRALAAGFLDDELEALGLEPRAHEYGTGNNVWAEIPATVDNAPYWIVGAHYDSVPSSPGANDNATGVAMVLSLARFAVESPCRRTNLIVVFFDQEEIGLVGSAAFASMLSDEAWPVLGAHTIDQMGWDDDGDRIVELEQPAPALLEFYQSAAALLDPVVQLVPTRTGSTDHESFRAVGYEAVGLTEEYASGDTTPHYHLPSDTYETVNFEFLRSSTVLLHQAFALDFSKS